MEQSKSKCGVLIAMLIAVAVTALPPADAQDAPTPLSDELFTQAIESSETAQWMTIRVMTDEQAKLLLKHRGVRVILGFAGDEVRSLYLNGLTVLTPQQARLLAKHEAALCLDGLKQLPFDVAKALAGYQGGYISRYLYAETLDEGHGTMNLGGIVTLNGLDSLSDELSRQICRMQPFELQLNGVRRLSETQAKNLARSKSFLLQLSSITSLSDSQAKSLSMFRGVIYLPGLDQESRDRFVKYGGELIRH